MAELKPFVVKFDGKEVTQTLKQINQELVVTRKERDQYAVGSEKWVEKEKERLKIEEKRVVVLNEANRATAALKDLDLSKFGAIGGKLDGIKTQFSDLRNGFGSVINSLGLVKTAIAGTGIGLLLVAFAALVQYFKSSDDGADKLERGMAALGAIFRVLRGVLSDFGRNIIAVFENPKQALKDLVELIGNNLLNRLKAFKVIYEAILSGDFKKVGDGFVQGFTGIENISGKVTELKNGVGGLATEMEAAAREAAAMTKAMQDLEDQRLATELSLAQNETLISKLLLQSKNRTLSERERISLLKQASKVELESHQLSVNLIDKEIEKANDKVAAMIRAANRTVDLTKKSDSEIIALAKKDLLLKGEFKGDEEKLYNDLLIKKENIGKASIELQEKINNRMDALEEAKKSKKAAREQKEEQDRKAADAKLKQQAEADLAALQKTQDLKIALIEDETKRKIAALELQAKREKEATEKSTANTELKADLIIAIEKKLTADVSQVQAEADKNKLDAAQKANQKELDLKRRQAQAEIDLELLFAQKAVKKANSGTDEAEQKAATDRLLAAQILSIQTKANIEIQNAQLTEEEIKLIKERAIQDVDNLKEQSALADRQRNLKTAQEFANAISSGMSAIADLASIQSQKDLTRANRDKTNRLKSLDDEYKKGMVSKENYEASKAQIEQGFENETKAIKRKQAEDQKKWNIAQAIMQGANAVIAALITSGGVPFSPLVISTGVMAGLNLAKVIATPLPEFAKGGVLNGPTHSQGGMKVIGANGQPVAEIEGGEPILSRATYRNNPELVNLLLDSSMNRGGSRVYIDPGLLTMHRYETGGILPGAGPISTGSGSDRQLRDQLARQHSEAMQKADRLYQLQLQQHDQLIKTIQNMDTVLKSYVVIGDVADGLNQLRAIKREASGNTSDGLSPAGPVILNTELF